MMLWGPMLTGLAQGFQDYQQNQEDLQYTKQFRANQLAGQQLANQSAQIQNAQQQQALQNADLTHKYWTGALADNGTAEGQGAARQAAPAAQPAGAGPLAAAGDGQGIKAPSFSPKGPMSVAQLASLDDKYGLPAGTAYGLMAAESNGNADAVSKKGAQGLFQVMPDTAAQPGYGLKPFSPKDPDGAVGYFSALYKKAGGDMSKALAMWNAGPKGNPNNPETQGFVPRVMKNAQQFAQANALDQAKQQPSPADQIAARESAGVDTPVTAYQQATQAQQHQIQTMLRAAQSAEKDGHPELAQNFYAQADKLQGSMLDLQKKGLDAQKEANDQTTKLASGVKDQSSYDNFGAQLAQNPAMRAATRGLGLTGDYELDKGKIQTLADRSMTLKDQGDLAIKQGELKLKQDAAARAQAKEEQPKIAAQQAQTADAQRRSAVAGKGIPFAPSIAATAPVGTPPQQIQQAQQKIAAQNQAYDKANAPAVQGAKSLADRAAQAYVMVDKGTVQTGGAMTTTADFLGNWALSQHQQEFNKLTNSMVQDMQLLSGANGGARSASTAAMYNNFAKAKPNVTMGPDANLAVAHGLYVGAVAQRQMNSFLDEYRQANPDASVQSGVMMWRAYEQSLGPTMVLDPAKGELVPSMAGIPAHEDGTSNPDYRDYHVFFANGGHW